ncbi:MAG: cryptochrome/photolyase family protein [Thiolinea sp.]
MSTALLWFRQDLRLADNPALQAAVTECEYIVPVFIDESRGNSGLHPAQSEASHVWLHHSLIDLAAKLKAKGAELIIRRGDALKCLQDLQSETGATHVYWNRRYDPVGIECDTAIKQQLSAHCQVRSFNGSLLSEPWSVLKKDDTPYRVFTAFWKAKLQRGFPELPLPEPARLAGAAQYIHGLKIEELEYLPAIRWDIAMMAHWQVGEDAAHEALDALLEQRITHYQTRRDLPAETGTSQLSPHLHFGAISPRQILHRAESYLADNPAAETGVRCFLSEIGWREFAYYLLYHFPQTVSESLDQRFKVFPWRAADDYTEDLQRWQQGQTGFPIIDAGMRQLWATGWMHNRVRMIVASLLTKNLLVPWQTGEQWFRNTLVDADLASNTMGWQWVAGCGADAAPYFRIFNPVLQSEKFDKAGEYIRRWVPELRDRDNKAIHQPRVLGDGVKNYPLPVVDLKTSRQRALERFGVIKKPL